MSVLVKSLPVVMLINGVAILPQWVFADDSVVDQVNVTVAESCTLGGVGMDTHVVTINNGHHDSAIGESILRAFCNDTNGFSIYAIGYTDDIYGKNVLSDSDLGSSYDIQTGTAIIGDTSRWAMKLSTVTSPVPNYPVVIAGSSEDTEKQAGDLDYSTFQPVPSSYTLVIKRSAGTDAGTGAEGAPFKTTYQAYAAPGQPAGTYTGQVKYTLVHPQDTTAPVIP